MLHAATTKTNILAGMTDRRQAQDAMVAVNEALQNALTAARALCFDASTLDETTKTYAAELLTILCEAEATMLRAWTPVVSLDAQLRSEYSRVEAAEQAAAEAVTTVEDGTKGSAASGS